MSLRSLIFITLSACPTYSSANDCLEWFLEADLAANSNNCELKCSITPVDMGTFSCTSECEELCSKPLTDHILSYVPRLTEGDRLLVSKRPYEAYQVFLTKQDVDSLTEKVFKRPGRNDESDAFRHFMWSVLLSKKLGPEKAKVFLDAHENDSTQSPMEREMDIHNNQVGLDFFKSYKKKSELSIEKIERSGLNLLKQRKLKVLKPKLKKIPGGYYSE